MGKSEFDVHYDQLCAVAERAQQVKDSLVRGVDEDTQAFDLVIEAMRMPKDTEAERVERARAVQEGYKAATLVPLATVEGCRDALLVCKELSALADPEMVSDVGTGAQTARAGAHSAAYNVRINLRHIKDEAFAKSMRSQVEALVAECEELTAAVVADVEKVLAA
jgi:formiminotetrahydrofolate cyclodeaminase